MSKKVPLVIYIGDDQHVIGEATIEGDEVKATIFEEVNPEISDYLDLGGRTLSMSLSEIDRSRVVPTFPPPLKDFYMKDKNET